MKKIIIIIFLLIFFLNFETAFAKTTLEVLSTSTTSGLVNKVEYQLPYPGILPDSPLYSFKIIRDRIVSFLISDPLKKAEFNLLTADKRLNTGVYLINKKQQKEELALSTISKGENYFEESLAKIEEAQKQGMNTKYLLKKVFISLNKHKEVLKSLEKKVSVKLNENLRQIEKRVENLEKRATTLSS